jgi:flagellar biosynthesis/type III secretory pathway chaperone
MSNSEPDLFRAQVSDLLGTSVLHALGLKESLAAEKAALETQDIDALNEAVANKSRCVTKLQALDSERTTLCAEAGFEMGPDQMDKVMQWCDTDSIIANCWNHLMQLAAECNALNMTNGAIIRARQHQIHANLSVLRGQPPEADTYGREAGGAAPNLRRSLAEA